MQGFSRGFSINFRGNYISTCSVNSFSAYQQPDIVERYLEKEIGAGRIAGPFLYCPLEDFCISPLGVVPKKVKGDFRIIQHLSYPRGSSINDGIQSEDTSVSYARVDHAVKLILSSGRGSYLAKTDIKSAFRNILINPCDYHLLGMFWRDCFYFDKCMPMGCASSCKIFEAFSTAVEWIARTKLKIKFMLHLLDDFLIVAPSQNICLLQLNCFLQLCAYLGIPMAPDKTMGPCQI